MRAYELLIIIKPNLDNDEVDKLTDKLSDSISTLGGKVSEVEKNGRKKLAYEISNFRDGFIAVFKMELPENNVVELKRQLKLNENIIRTMFLELSKVK